MFQVKNSLSPELKLAANDGYADLILIWPHSHFQQNNVIGPFYKFFASPEIRVTNIV